MRYRFLQREYGLSDETLADLKDELIEAQAVVADKDGKMLVWTGSEAPEEISVPSVHTSAAERPSSSFSVQPEPETSVGERRQSTVMFCDLVNSTALSEQLDPEELQTVVRTYQEVSAQVIERHEGHIT